MRDRWTLLAIAACLGLGAIDLAYMNTRLVPVVLAERETERRRDLAVAAADSAPLARPGSAPVAIQGSAPTIAGAAAIVAPRPAVAPDPARTEPSPREPSAEPAPAPTRATEAQAVETVYFARDRARLDARSRARLQALADRLRAESAVGVAIEGHADRRGDSLHNTRLSERRAERVAAFLGELGVDAELFAVRAFGESRPADPRNRPDAHRRNRRVVVRYRWEEP